jgi:hypothetical protein
MITVLLKNPQTNDEKAVMVEFPCNNIYLSEKLCEIDIADIKQNICYTLKVDEEYSCLSVFLCLNLFKICWHLQLLIEKLPTDHKARWFAGSALNTVNT